MGTAYLKKDDLDQALLYYNKSLSENRAQDILKKVQEVCFVVFKVSLGGSDSLLMSIRICIWLFYLFEALRF